MRHNRQNRIIVHLRPGLNIYKSTWHKTPSTVYHRCHRRKYLRGGGGVLLPAVVAPAAPMHEFLERRQSPPREEPHVHIRVLAEPRERGPYPPLPRRHVHRRRHGSEGPGGREPHVRHRVHRRPRHHREERPGRALPVHHPRHGRARPHRDGPAEVRVVANDSPHGGQEVEERPLPAEERREVPQVFHRRLPYGGDVVAQPPHAHGRELGREELRPQLLCEHGYELDDVQTYPPLVVLAEVEYGGEERLCQQPHPDHTVERAQTGDQIQAHLTDLVSEQDQKRWQERGERLFPPEYRRQFRDDRSESRPHVFALVVGEFGHPL
mmetsp:Transcript_49804/g.97419  ORF Transcript_49804/g.97419 Transcript_49804/m.97419 type:complete len:323 (-) Transcript_49804:783-1751(-)